MFLEIIEVADFPSDNWVAHHRQHLEVPTTAVTVPSMCGVSQEVKISRANARLDLELKALICGDPFTRTREMML
jgi:hypothetical protein